jgi:hypothetical protein
MNGIRSPGLSSPQSFLTPSIGLQASRIILMSFFNLPLPFIAAERNAFVIHP